MMLSDSAIHDRNIEMVTEPKQQPTNDNDVKSWKGEGLVLRAPDKIISTEALLAFAQKAHGTFPNADVVLAEFCLRVTHWEDEAHVGPSAYWRD
jgi:hypothetical protein